MAEEPGSAARDELARARETIARQAEEIAAMRERVADGAFADELRQALTLAATAGTIAAPVTHSRLLEMIVETAAYVIAAQAGSLFLVDHARQELIFEVAIGPRAQAVKQFRVPLGQGIAGLVAVTGQPMAVADVQEDPRHASGIAQAVGYLPRSILCVPLLYDDQVIGVLELLDKEGADAFSASDLAVLGMFATQAAVAIEQSRTQGNLLALIGAALESLSGLSDETRAVLREGARAFAGRAEEDPIYRRSLELARMIQEIGIRGEREIGVCRAILRAFAAYLRSQPAMPGGSGAGW